MGKKANCNCSVYGCHSKKGREPTVHFHKYPAAKANLVCITNGFGVVEKVNRRKAWEMKLLVGKPVTKSMLVCSKHFIKEDYLSNGLCVIRPKLKLTAVPSQNLPTKPVSIQKEEDTRRRNRYEQRQQLRKQPFAESQCVMDEDFDLEKQGSDAHIVSQDVPKYDQLTPDEQLVSHGLVSLQNSTPSACPTSDKGVQVTSGDIFISFTSTIQSNKHLNSLTGVPSFQLLNTLVNLISESYPNKIKHTLSIKDRVILVFMKLKTAVKFIVLSVLFKISQSTCRSVFNEYIHYLAGILKPCIPWPAIEEIRNNIPACFKNFKNVRVVLNCIEIPVQRAKCLCCRLRTYSHYKGGHTIKFMTGVSPAGLITLVSKAYGGHSSDKAIFEQSGVITKLESHIDSIMVDKGFYIGEICDRYFIKLVRPHYVKKKKQFSEKESKENVSIARARVHIERLNQRIKMFDIFNCALPWNMVKQIDDIFLVAAGMVNLQHPILADDKF